MILHVFINIQICCWWGIKSGQKFINHDQKLHLGGLLNK